MPVYANSKPINYETEEASEDELQVEMAKKSLKGLVFLLIVGGLMILIGGIMFPVVDYIVKEEIKKKVVISNKSELYDIWQDIPIPVYMQFYVFDIANEKEILKGEKPFVVQRGPYTYRESRVKFNIVWNHNGTVSYRQNRTFHFVRNMSIGPDTDIITTINPLMAVIAQGLRWFPDDLRKVISFALSPMEKEGIFITRSVHDVVFGYNDDALFILNKIIPIWFDRYEIGYFMRKNYTDDGLYTVFTGEKNLGHVGIIDKYNGKRHVDLWTSEWANMINGSDGTLGPPFRFNEYESPVFTSDLCRSLYGVYSGHVSTPQGIELRRFGPDDMEVANATVNPDNAGFCTPRGNCLPAGLMNSTLCQEPVDGFPLPIIFSFPHFLYAAPEVQNSVYGMFPNEKEHGTFVDVEPWTGLVLQASKRLQINIFVQRIEGIVQTYNIRTTFFPVLWLNESSVVDDKHAQMLKDQLFTPLLITKVAKIGLLCLGSLFFLIASSLLIRRRMKNKKEGLRVPLIRESIRGPQNGIDAQHSFDNPITETLTPSPREVTPASEVPTPRDVSSSHGKVSASPSSFRSIEDDSSISSVHSVYSSDSRFQEAVGNA